MNHSNLNKLDSLIENYLHLGSAMYGGESVTQLEHALQCAHLSQVAGEPPALIAACLLHDVGHLLSNTQVAANDDGDDHHEKLAMQHLQDLFGPEVTQPIYLHVNAKRYLCSVDLHYWRELSIASQKSLEIQGGVFSAKEALDFVNLPYAKDAIKLRLFDDLAKVPKRVTPELNEFKALLQSLIRQ